jgi:hypothetical protein
MKTHQHPRLRNCIGSAVVSFLLFSTGFCATPSVAQDEASAGTSPGSNGDYLFSREVHQPASVASSRPDPSASDPAVIRARQATLHPERLRPPSGIGLQDRLVLNLFDDTVFVAIRDRVERNASGSLTWIGHLDGVALSSVLLVVRDDAVVAKVAFPGGVYVVDWGADGTQRIEQIDQSRIIEHETEMIEIEAVPETSAAGLGGVEVAADVAADDGSTMDVLVVYSPEARADAGGQAAIESLIELAVAESNVAYENSHIDQRIDLVHMYESPVAQLGDLDSDGSHMDDNLVGLQAPSDGYLDGVHGVRDEYHADFVQLIVQEGCGLAYTQSSPQDSGFEDFAFSVVSTDCAASNYSLAHEIGHNMGLLHDWYADDSTAPHPWAHGFTNPTHSWRTVMAYNNYCSDLGGNCNRLLYFSNPSILFGGNAMGVPANTASNCVAGQTSPAPTSCDADSQSVLSTNAATNSQFRSSEITWLGNSTDWTDPNNWEIQQGAAEATTTINRVPRSIDDVVIPNTAVSPTISSGTIDARNLVIEDGAHLSMTGGTLHVHGEWEEQGNGTFSGSGGAVIFDGTVDQSLSVNAGSTFHDLTIGDGVSSQAVSLQSDLEVTGDVVLRSGTRLYANAHSIRVAGNWDDQAGAFVPGTGRFILTGVHQNLEQAPPQMILDESFSAADGQSCCGSGQLPSGWVREQSAGSGFLGGDVGPDGGAVVRFPSSPDPADAWLFTTGLSLRTIADYQLSFDYRTFNAGGRQQLQRVDRYGSIFRKHDLADQLGHQRHQLRQLLDTAGSIQGPGRRHLLPGYPFPTEQRERLCRRRQPERTAVR